MLPDDRTIDVRFDEFMADDVAMIERIYAMADQPFDDGVRAAMIDATWPTTPAAVTAPSPTTPSSSAWT